MRVSRGTIAGNEYTRDRIGRLYGLQEECQCSCGWPLYVGDFAIMVEDGECFCSDKCMHEFYRDEEQEQADVSFKTYCDEIY